MRGTGVTNKNANNDFAIRGILSLLLGKTIFELRLVLGNATFTDVACNNLKPAYNARCCVISYQSEMLYGYDVRYSIRHITEEKIGSRSFACMGLRTSTVYRVNLSHTDNASRSAFLGGDYPATPENLVYDSRHNAMPLVRGKNKNAAQRLLKSVIKLGAGDKSTGISGNIRNVGTVAESVCVPAGALSTSYYAQSHASSGIPGKNLIHTSAMATNPATEIVGIALIHPSGTECRGSVSVF